MKRVLLIIACNLVATTACTEAAPADPGAAALATLQQAGARTNPFLEDGQQEPKPHRNRLHRERSLSEPATPTHTPSTAAARALKKVKAHHNLTQLELKNDQNSSDADDKTDEELEDVFDSDNQEQRETVSPEYTIPPLEITSCLGELVTARYGLAAYGAGRRIIPATALPVIAWLGSRTHWAQA